MNNKSKLVATTAVLLLLLCVGYAPMYAQSAHAEQGMPAKSEKKAPKGENYRDYITKKRQFLMKYVGLSAEDSIAFFPLYDALQRKRFDLQRQARRSANELARRETTPSEEECLVLARRLNGMRKEEGELAVAYFKQFEEILTPKQLLKLELSEMRFNHYLLNQTRGKYGERKNIRKK